MKTLLPIVAMLLTLFACALRVRAEEKYEIGGPLAGVKLPAFPTQHGEEAGHPGHLPGKFQKNGQVPILQLYPGAAELYQANAAKRFQVRSFFDRQSQLKNWNAP